MLFCEHVGCNEDLYLVSHSGEVMIVQLELFVLLEYQLLAIAVQLTPNKKLQGKSK